MRYQLDLRSLAYLVCGPLLATGLAGLLGTIHVPSATSFDDIDCGSVLAYGDYLLLDQRTADACDEAVSDRGWWSYPTAVIGLVGVVALSAMGRKPDASG